MDADMENVMDEDMEDVMDADMDANTAESMEEATNMAEDIDVIARRLSRRLSRRFSRASRREDLTRNVVTKRDATADLRDTLESTEVIDVVVDQRNMENRAEEVLSKDL
jgi:hypothetical protein